MKKIFFAALCVLLPFLAENSSGAELFSGGRSNCVIVIDENASLQLKDAAEELRHFLFRISGAETADRKSTRLNSSHP